MPAFMGAIIGRRRAAAARRRRVLESRPGDAARPARSRAPGGAPRGPRRRRARAGAGAGPVILFLIDNSASLPPLDPSEKRVTALEKMFTFLQGQRYRLVLFGGRREIFVDDVSQYRNDGQWTDFYCAFVKAKEIAAGLPAPAPSCASCC